MKTTSLAFICLAALTASGAGAEEITFGRFGKVTVYHPAAKPSEAVIFVSGDGGWNLGVVDMARALSSLGALVAGVDIIQYLRELRATREECSYAAADFEALSKFLQKKYDFPEYRPPVLVGYSSGATLVYATLAQAPPNTFRGAISLGFCPDIDIARPLCRGSGLEWTAGPRGRGYSFLPATNLSAPWIAFQGIIDQVCFARETGEYVRQVPRGEIVLLPKVGHGFLAQRNWMPQFKKAYDRLVKPPKQAAPPLAAGVSDLPLVEVPLYGHASSTLAVIVTGDGGWASIDREIGEFLAAGGMHVVGFNSLQYYWKRRTPQESSRDLARVLEHYVSRWHCNEVVLIGYSLGADVLPFMAAGLPPDLLARVRVIALLGPGRRAAFEFHLRDWITGSPGPDTLPVLPEVVKLSGKKILCIYGESERDSLCRDLEAGPATPVPLAGAHHFGGRYREIAGTILRELNK